MRVVKLVAVAGFLAPGLLAGQRHPVLRQIMVPHSYYYREMYLPQVTSGPSAVTWSPDGRELIYSMQGSLWRQRIGSTEARQLTSGRGYDFQPDWSPDGDRLVYVSYRNDAIELRLLELRTGETADLLSNGAVNVEPRWSPDGKRIAYISNEKGNADLLYSRFLADGGTLHSIVPLDRLEVVGNGEVMAQIPLTGDRTQVSTKITLPVDESGWYLLRATGKVPAYPILDVYPYATTSPIYVIVEGKPIRSRSDAEYFVAWIDRLLAGALAVEGWNSEEDKATTLETLRRAREEFIRRLGP
jgi:dipeptidyl aminopeptidase/acylaminoacyl peptidase